MRFESIHIRRFGCLEDVRIGTPETALPSIVAILGPNESGKSTFFSFLTALLYGFYPAKRATNPYTPWLGEDPPEGSARIRLDDGEVQEVHRRLMAVPWGRLHTRGREQDVGNQTLPCVAALGSVPKGVFEQAYALTLTELSGLEGKSWDLVQDRLVGSMGTDLKPASRVVSESMDEANRFWRPDRRGLPLAKKLQSQLGKLGNRRAAAQRRDQDLRKKVSELARAEVKRKALDEERQRLRERQTVKNQRLTVLLPVRNRLSGIERLRVRAGPMAELEGLPRDPRQHLENLRKSERQAESQIADLASEADDYRGIIERERPNVDELENRLDVLLPVRRRLSRIKELRDLAGPSEELEGLPADPQQHLKNLRDLKRQAESQIADLAREADGYRSIIERERPNVDELRHRLHVLLPVKRRLSRIKDLRDRSGPSEELNRLPRDPRGRLEELKNEHRNARTRVEEADGVVVRLRRAIEDSRSERQVVAILEQKVSAAQDRLAELTRKLGEVVRKAEKLSERSAGRSRDLFSVPWDQVDRSEVSAVPVKELGEQVRKYRGISQQRVVVEKNGPGADAPGQHRLVLGLVFAVVVGWLLSLLSVAAALAVLGGVIVGCCLIVPWFVRAARAKRSRERWTQRIKALASEEEVVIDDVRKLVGELPIHAWLLEPRNLDHLLERIRGMVDLSRDVRESECAVERRRARLDDETNAVNEMVAEQVGRLRETTTIAVYEDLGAQASALHEAKRNIQRSIDVDKTSLASAEANLKEAKDVLRNAASRRRTIEETLASLGGGSVDRGLTEAVERLDARHRASELRSELERDHPDLDVLVGQIHDAEASGETWETLAEQLRTAREAQDETQNSQGRLETVESQLASAERRRDTGASELRAFTRKLESFGGGSVDRGLTEAVERLDARHRASELRSELERDHPDLDVLVGQIHDAEASGETWETLAEQLRTAREAQDEAQSSQGKLETVESQRASAERRRDALASELRAFTSKLASFGDGSVDHGLAEAVERLDARHRARELRCELERDHPDLDELVDQIHDAEASGERWSSLSEDLAEIDERLHTLSDDGRKQGELVGRLENEVQRIQKEETADQVRGEIELVKDQLLDVKESRDRLFLLARLVQEADRRFREEHQPALLKQAGKYVDQITGGRYDRIMIGEAGEKFFSLRDPTNFELRKMSDPFSQGIKEQVYFALRLAAIDQLDADMERLPLFLDEVFVNWDPLRLDRAFQLVEQVARQRQVFFFTCHEAMAAKLEDAGGRIFELG